jgi:hypothetical protein
MGIFSKAKKETSSRDDQVKQVVTKFQGWTSSYTETEINGKSVSPTEINELVEYVILKSMDLNDELMLQWSSKVCVAMLSATTDVAPVATMAQVLFDSGVGSMTLRKKYSKDTELLEAITTLGVASYKVSERHPNFNEVLEYMRDNAKKLSGE